MNDLDHQRLAEALIRILRERDTRDVDAQGWASIDEVRMVASSELETEIHETHVRVVSTRGRFEIQGGRIRIQRRRKRRGPPIPDILFHATTDEGVERVRGSGMLTGGRRRLTLSDDEVQAWRAAHRMHGRPKVLVIDTLRSRRSGARFFRNRHNGLYSATDIPVRHVLNLREGYDVQLSAGGIPLMRGEDGEIKLALIKVSRRSGTTWEVAKGKLEPGESPEVAAVREVQEEMGIEVGFDIVRYVGPVRYGFLAPGGAPRLKTIDLYLMVPTGEVGRFSPSEREGIGDVQWFSPDEAVRAVTHSSLRPVMRRARELILQHGTDPAPSLSEGLA